MLLFALKYSSFTGHVHVVLFLRYHMNLKLYMYVQLLNTIDKQSKFVAKLSEKFCFVFLATSLPDQFLYKDQKLSPLQDRLLGRSYNIADRRPIAWDSLLDPRY